MYMRAFMWKSLCSTVWPRRLFLPRHCLPGVVQQRNWNAKTEFCMFINLSAFRRGVGWGGNTPWCYHAVRCESVCCVCFPSPWTSCSTWSSYDALPASRHESSISSSRTAVRRRDFNIITLFLEGFVLRRPLLIYGGNWGGGWLVYT